jgi:predicted small secreted protein
LPRLSREKRDLIQERNDAAIAAFREGLMMRSISIVVILAAAALTAACNTVQGVGKDVASAGDAVAKAAK